MSGWIVAICIVFYVIKMGANPLKALLTTNTHAGNGRPDPNKRSRDTHRCALVDVLAVPGTLMEETARAIWSLVAHAATYLWKQFVRSAKALFAELPTNEKM